METPVAGASVPPAGTGRVGSSAVYVLFTFQSKLSRRIFVLFALSALVPLLVSTGLSAFRMRSSLLDQAGLQLGDLSRAAGTATLERIEFLAERMSAGAAVADGRRFDNVYRSANLGRLLGGARISDPVAAARHLREGGILLVTGPGEGIHLVRWAGTREYERATIRPGYLWQSASNMPEDTGLCVADSAGELLFCSEPLSSEETWALMSGPGSREPASETADTDAVSGRWSADLTVYAAKGWTFTAYRGRQLILDSGLSLGFSPLLAPLVVVFVLLLTFAQIRKTVDPLGELLDATGRMASGDFGRRVNVRSRDEFEELGASFNTMAERLGRQFAALRQLSEFDRLILTSPEADSLVPAALARIREVTDAGWLAIALRSGPRWLASIQDGETLSAGLPCSVSRRFVSQLEDAPAGCLEADPRRLPDPLAEVADRSTGRGTFLMPVVDSGMVNGFIAIEQPERGWRERLEAVRSFADRLAVALATVERERRLFQQAHFDPLTSLPNRTLFRQRLDAEVSRAVRDGFGGAVLYADLDDFKVVNDTVGHAAGDYLLRQVAERLVHAVREDVDTVARLGGDEFTVLLPGLVTDQELADLAGRVQGALARPYRINGEEASIGVSIGIARYPQDGESADEILHNADSAMYQSKHPGHSGFALFRRADDAEVQARIRLSAELQQAIARQELELYYQPQVDVRGGAVTGAEALLRWRHPDHGLLLPNAFIPLAEENGMILDIGSWVLEEACRTLAAWRARSLAPCRMSINVAPRQFCHGQFAREIHRRLTDLGLPPECLELEITESVLAAPGAAGHHALGQLASLGVRLVIDDFGTGYAGVGLLKGLPVHGMKVDRTFVRDVPDREEAVAGADAIVALAGALGKDLIVEGVETPEQLAFFRQRGCRVFQGYLFSEPLSRVEFETAVEARERFAVA